MTDMFDPLTAAVSMKDLAENAVRRFEMNDAEISRLDSEWGDLAHLVELTAYDEEGGRRILNRQRANRKARRRCKDENAVLKPLYDHLVKADKQVLKLLTWSGKESARITNGLSKRQYTPRTELITPAEFKERMNDHEHTH